MESLALCRLLGVWLIPSKDAPTITSLLADESWLPIQMIVQQSSSDWNADLLAVCASCWGQSAAGGFYHLKAASISS